MNKFKNIIFAALINFLLFGAVFGQVSAENDLEKIAKDFIPEGMQSAHKAVKGLFAQSASEDKSGNIVVLYGKEMNMSGYKGLVLVPKGFEAFDQYELPEPQSTWSMMDPISVFFANADKDSENELFIIDECYTGIGPTGAQAFYRTRVYDWNGGGFAHLETVSEKIGNFNTAAKVRKKLPQIIKTTKTVKVESFQTIDVSQNNLKIEKAALGGETWVKEPTQIISRMIREFSEIRSRTIEMTAPTSEGADSLIVTVIDDGFLDDSVRGDKHKFELKMNEQGVWKFVSAGKSWRCREGRGQQDFSTVKCL